MLEVWLLNILYSYKTEWLSFQTGMLFECFNNQRQDCDMVQNLKITSCGKERRYVLAVATVAICMQIK